MTTSDNTIMEIAEKYWQLTSDLIQEHNVEAVAGTMMQQAMTMYKTFLTDSEYELMMLFIYESRHRVQSLSVTSPSKMLN